MDLGIFFRAKRAPVCRWVAIQTIPNLPYPNFAPSWKSPIVNNCALGLDNSWELKEANYFEVLGSIFILEASIFSGDLYVFSCSMSLIYFLLNWRGAYFKSVIVDTFLRRWTDLSSYLLLLSSIWGYLQSPISSVLLLLAWHFYWNILPCLLNLSFFYLLLFIRSLIISISFRISGPLVSGHSLVVDFDWYNILVGLIGLRSWLLLFLSS